MTRGARIGLVVAVLFLLVNAAGAWWAAARWETIHALIHVALLIPAAYFVWRLVPKRYAGRIGGRRDALPHELTDRLTNLEQSIDAVAVEVERIGEGQRFMTRVLTEKGAARPAGEGAAAPAEVKPPDAPPHLRD